MQVSHEWPGFPVGVKFDPSDVELLEHLAAKCCIGNREPHMFIHQFIPTLEGEQGICYTHPQNLPGEGFSDLFKYVTIYHLFYNTLSNGPVICQTSQGCYSNTSLPMEVNDR